MLIKNVKIEKRHFLDDKGKLTKPTAKVDLVTLYPPFKVLDIKTSEPVGEIVELTRGRLNINVESYKPNLYNYCELYLQSNFPYDPVAISLYAKEPTEFTILEHSCNFPIEDISYSKIIRKKLEKNSCISPFSPIGHNKSLGIYAFFGKQKTRIYRYI